MGGMMGGTGFGTLGLLGGILNLVVTAGLILGVVVLAVWLVRKVGADGSLIPTARWPEPGPSPREILQRRYAGGEITREQFQQMLADVP